MPDSICEEIAWEKFGLKEVRTTEASFTKAVVEDWLIGYISKLKAE